MSSDADDGIDLRVKRLWAPERVYCDAVLFDFVESSLEILIANESQQADEVVRSAEHTRRQNAIYFSPLGLKLADRRLHVDIPLRMVPSPYHPLFGGEYNAIYGTDTEPNVLN